jgi:ribosomal protein L37E
LLAFQSCTTLITFFAKQIGKDTNARRCGHESVATNWASCASSGMGLPVGWKVSRNWEKVAKSPPMGAWVPKDRR